MTKGFTVVAGIDEVGRGPLAGPVVAAVVILPPNPKRELLKNVRDSKLTSQTQRERLLPRIEKIALEIATGVVSPKEIDNIGIVSSTHLAMKRALSTMTLVPQFVLIDGFPLPGIKILQKHIVRGDSTCLSIASASIAAKVTRDRIMEKEDTIYPEYGFRKHKGYATVEHLTKLKSVGPCPIHRFSFAPIKTWDYRR